MENFNKCHSEHSEESRSFVNKRFFTPLRSVQNDNSDVLSTGQKLLNFTLWFHAFRFEFCVCLGKL